MPRKTTKSVEFSAETLASIAEAMGQKFQPKTVEVPSEPSPFLGQTVVVRTYTAGVHIGTLVAKNGKNVLLADAVRLWKWEGAFTLSEVAESGVGKKSRISERVEHIELTEATEIIGASDKAVETFEPRNGA